MADRHLSILPDRIDKTISIGAIILLMVTLIALINGSQEWAQIPLIVWAHVLPATIALALTPIILLRKRGNQAHRLLGYFWITAMAATAGFSLFVKVTHPGHYSWIHILSVFTLLNLPLVIYHARKHNIRKHQLAIRSMTIGALLIAGSFTFTFDRLLANWLFDR